MQSTDKLLPVRGDDAAEILINDHQVIKSLLADLTEATQQRKRKSTLERLKAVLTIHNATEENLVYPAIRTVAGKKIASDHLYHETAEADVLVFELDALLKEGDEEKFEATARKLQKAVLEHIDDEENKAFPSLQERAEPEQAQTLTEEVRKFRASLHFEPATA
jgi:hemerythrin superfamily protein